MLRPSTHLTVVGFGNGVVVFEAAEERTHILGPTAGWLVSMPGPSRFDALAQELAVATGADIADASETLAATVEILCGLGLVDRAAVDLAGAEQITGAASRPGPSHQGASHLMLDRAIAFRSDDGATVERLDAILSTTVADVDPTDFIDVNVRDDGHVLVDAANRWEFLSWDGLLAQLHQVLTDFPAAAHTMLCLHAGAVRTPAGEVIVVTGDSGSGKSTLVAALVTAGCDYLGDEHIGVRPGTLIAVGCPQPLRLDAGSRYLLSLDGAVAGPGDAVSPDAIRAGVRCLVGPVAAVGRVVLPEFDTSTDLEVTVLDPVAALRSTAGLAFNLGRAPATVMKALCGLAEIVPFERVRHPGVDAAVAHLLNTKA